MPALFQLHQYHQEQSRHAILERIQKVFLQKPQMRPYVESCMRPCTQTYMHFHQHHHQYHVGRVVQDLFLGDLMGQAFRGR